ncbi:hypothetical protein EU537_07830 [Candidatus Thorarchaeota archaeon]|nr:MAG: hypothetical protein EU537_07830 [Candidatus Thorarchaeota archaeon]
MNDIKIETRIDNNLSHSAAALLQALKNMQCEDDAGIFQPGPEVGQLREYLATYKGNLYDAVLGRLEDLIGLGGIEVVSQDVLLNLIKRVWNRKVSKLNGTEVKAITGLLKCPHLSIKDLARQIDLSYGQTRRAIEQLQSTSILEFKSIPNVAKLGLDRILIELEEPETLLISPYITRYLFVDGPIRRVFLIALFPSNYRDQILRVVRTLRRDSQSATAWRLSTGKPHFSAKYYDRRKKRWHVNELHFRLLLRTDHDLAMGELPTVSKLSFPPKMSETEVMIIDHLMEDYNASAREIADSVDASESMVYRYRSKIQSKKLAIPRARISVPLFTDRIIGTCTPAVSAKIMHAWKRLPLTYISQISNIENHRERKVLLTTALPAGGAETIIEALTSENLMVREFQLYKMDASLSSSFRFSNRYDHMVGNWLWDSDDIDITTYPTMRSNAESTNLPLDLA